MTKKNDQHMSVFYIIILKECPLVKNHIQNQSLNLVKITIGNVNFLHHNIIAKFTITALTHVFFPTFANSS